MPMVTLACLVVITQHADFIDYERQSILERVKRTTHRSRHSPNDNLDERSRVKHMAFIDQQLRRHVVICTNALLCCQLVQHSDTQTGMTGNSKYDAISPPAYIVLVAPEL
jgi:hypothetical protein